MSHFTNIETRFQNLFYLEKALNKLDIAHKRQKKVTNVLDQNRTILILIY